MKEDFAIEYAELMSMSLISKYKDIDLQTLCCAIAIILHPFIAVNKDTTAARTMIIELIESESVNLAEIISIILKEE